MSDTSRGGAAVAMLRAHLAGQDYPPEGIPDTEHNRQVWNSIGEDLANMPEGVLPDVPSDYTEQPPD